MHTNPFRHCDYVDASTSEDVSASVMKPEVDLKAVSAQVGHRWPRLAKELGLTSEEIAMVTDEPLTGDQSQSEFDHQRCEHMLSLWTQKTATHDYSSDANLGESYPCEHVWLRI